MHTCVIVLQSCLVILCNIFLNLIIVEPELVPEHSEFSHIVLLVVKGIGSIGELVYKGSLSL